MCRIGVGGVSSPSVWVCGPYFLPSEHLRVMDPNHMVRQHPGSLEAQVAGLEPARCVRGGEVKVAGQPLPSWLRPRSLSPVGPLRPALALGASTWQRVPTERVALG